MLLQCFLSHRPLFGDLPAAVLACHRAGGIGLTTVRPRAAKRARRSFPLHPALGTRACGITAKIVAALTAPLRWNRLTASRTESRRGRCQKATPRAIDQRRLLIEFPPPARAKMHPQHGADTEDRKGRNDQPGIIRRENNVDDEPAEDETDPQQHPHRRADCDLIESAIA